jgi:molecular chaperone HtpG
MSKPIKIPPKLEDILDADHTLSGFVKSSVSEFAPWLEQNYVKFFSEYPDHGLKHVENVLETADKLIREKCRGIISAGDVATLILATLLHDCAMHLSVDGFKTLIKSNNVINGFGDKPWARLWEDFIAESRRFSGRKLMALFGDTKPLKPPPSDPNDLDSHEMTGRDLLLIGEFLRRHHHRLAHEIAQFGVPGPDGNKLKLPEKEETKHIVDLAGVVARSHGLPIRSCHDYLRDRYSSFKSHKGVHPVFLMSLLRIADILQLQSTRAPRQVPKVRSLRSPVSQGEWEMHQAIEDIKWTEFPETIFIHAEPPNARTFIRIKDLITQIQHELDSSWTVMSEAYYSEESLRELGLKIRRVRSNLDDEAAFAKNVNYIPCQAAFEVADTDLLKLLIGPLYGERPEIGIRELMQNSIDAVRELREYLKKHPERKDDDLTEQEAEVIVSIDEEEDGWWVTVSDQGIGMTVDTVRDYFLKAGASLRRSEIWRKTFENEEGKSQVLRSGRFGVGMLAAFLLGDEINVDTRHISECDPNKGIAFTAQLDSEVIELQRIKRSVGTTIRVRISNEVKDELLGKWYKKEGKWENQHKWDWYCLTNPKVQLEYRKEKLCQEYQLPAYNSKLPVEWHRISHPDYQDIHWTYWEAPFLTCNGIKIIDTEDESILILESFYWGYPLFDNPNISIFDYDANLPLNLQRTDLTQYYYPFYEELVCDVLKDFISYAFVNVPIHPIDNTLLFKWCSKLHYPEKKEHILDSAHLSPWFFTKYGVSFAYDSWHTSRIDADYALMIHSYQSPSSYGRNELIPPYIAPGSSHAVFVNGGTKFYHYKKDFAISLSSGIGLSLSGYDFYSDIFLHPLKDTLKKFTNLFIRGKRALISRHVLEFIDSVSKFERVNFLPEKLISKVVEEWKNENWVLWRLGDCPSPGFDFEKFASENDGKNYEEWPCILAEWYFKDKKKRPKYKLSPLAKVWREVVGSPIIPFDLEERRKMKVYKELKPYIEAHEKMKHRWWE